MKGLRGIGIAVIAVTAIMLSGCARMSVSSAPPELPGLVSCAPTYPGWYVYPPQKYCYPAWDFM